MSQNSEITLAVEPAQCLYRPTQQKVKFENQEECFVLFFLKNAKFLLLRNDIETNLF